MSETKWLAADYNHSAEYGLRRLRGIAVTLAGKAVRNAIKRGALVPASVCACADCGGTAVEYDHYLGYEREHWLKVQPVCHRCHVARHVRRRVTAQGRVLKAMP